VACELLGGALSGGGTWHTTDRSKKRVLNGMLTILIDPKKLGTADAFVPEAGAFVEWVKRSPPAPGADRVRIAGDPERETRARRSREGIAVDVTTWQEIHAAAAKVGLAAEVVDRLATG
jgi:hydroxycarboxylate dehydrogenase B